jgi:hypothetical protein
LALSAVRQFQRLERGHLLELRKHAAAAGCGELPPLGAHGVRVPKSGPKDTRPG